MLSIVKMRCLVLTLGLIMLFDQTWDYSEIRWFLQCYDVILSFQIFWWVLPTCASTLVKNIVNRVLFRLLEGLSLIEAKLLFEIFGVECPITSGTSWRPTAWLHFQLFLFTCIGLLFYLYWFIILPVLVYYFTNFCYIIN